MRRKMERIMERWGHYFLALLCAGVILFSALWTRSVQDAEIRDARALSDQSQHLADALEETPGLAWPATGEMLDGFHESAAFYPRYSLWHTHPGIDFATTPGDDIFCMADGIVAETAGMIEIHQDNGDVCRYFGAAECLVHIGQRVKAGESLGKSGGATHVEGEGDRICVMLIRGGTAVDFSGELMDNNQ